MSKKCDVSSLFSLSCVKAEDSPITQCGCQEWFCANHIKPVDHLAHSGGHVCAEISPNANRVGNVGLQGVREIISVLPMVGTLTKASDVPCTAYQTQYCSKNVGCECMFCHQNFCGYHAQPNLSAAQFGGHACPNFTSNWGGILENTLVVVEGTCKVVNLATSPAGNVYEAAEATYEAKENADSAPGYYARLTAEPPSEEAVQVRDMVMTKLGEIQAKTQEFPDSEVWQTGGKEAYGESVAFLLQHVVHFAGNTEGFLEWWAEGPDGPMMSVEDSTPGSANDYMRFTPWLEFMSLTSPEALESADEDSDSDLAETEEKSEAF